jgi:hypothetical protein
MIRAPGIMYVQADVLVVVVLLPLVAHAVQHFSIILLIIINDLKVFKM